MTSSSTIHRLIIIDQELFDNKNFVESLNQNFNIPVEFEDLKALEKGLANDARNNTVGLYISSSFDGPVFECLLALQKPVISDIVVQHCIQNRVSLPIPKHPLFNYFMKDFIICFSIDDKRQTHIINKYLNLIRFMGGQSRRDMKTGKSFERTHLIDSRTDSVNYRLACIYEIPVLYKEWVDHFWEHRRDTEFDPNDESHLSKFRIKPLVDLRISLYNFEADGMEEIVKSIQEAGGHYVPLYDENTTHLVVRNESESNYLDILNNFPVIPKFIVSEMWLENSLRLNYRDPEEQHLLKIPLDDKTFTENGTPTKDEHSTLNSIFLSPNYDHSIVDDCSIVDKNDMKKQAIVQELYQTELNYVQILKDIIRIFRDPLKNHQMPGQFPNEIELKTIFGGLPPIIDVHEKILSELEPVAKNWKAENEIGKIFQKHSQNFLTVYPQYVNFYEKTKETIDECINKYPKFNSFLKACQTSSECRKQTFQELLINPIQRLPRIELYLRTLLDRTDKLHPDFKPLNEALETIVAVNKVINNEKKKTENQMELFELLNDIEDCPATLVSAHRHFIAKCDAKLLILNPSNEADNVTVHKLENYLFSLLLFTDWILICKKRVVKRTNSLRDRTPNLPLNVSKKSKKSYKYIETVELASLKQIFKDFEEQETLPDFHEAFALVSNNKDPTGNYFLIYPFVVKDAVMNKEKFVENIVKAFENLVENTTDSEFVKRGALSALDWSHSKTIARSLSKSKYVIMRTKERLNRTFSMRRQTRNLLSVSMENLTAVATLPTAPSSSRLSRVFNNLNFFSPKENGFTASPNITRAELFTDINELDHSTDDGGDNFSLPATPAPRKKKTMYQN